MPLGRESRRSAADAVARPFALALVLVSTTLPRGALSDHGVALPPLALPPPRPKSNTTTCDHVPSPFGTRRAPHHLPDFEVICGPNMEAMLRIGDDSYRIDSVSVPGSYVVIFAGPISQVCYDRHGRPAPDTGTGPISLKGTPFTFSKRNSLVSVGCNHRLIANFTNPPGDPSPWPPASCATWCDGGSTGAIIGGSCLGEACCEIPIPDQVIGAQALTLSFNRTKENVAVEEYGTCSAAFFLDRDEQVFTFGGGDDGGKMPLDKALLPQGERRMILDWAIGSSTCDHVPSPFGTRRAPHHLPGFEVICGPNMEAMLRIGDDSYRIDSVSVPGSYVVIFAGPISQVCYDRHGRPAPDTGTGPISLKGTPFTFSKRNSLVSVGCNHRLIANFTNPPGDPSPWPPASCATWCDGGSTGAIIGGSCLGEACCEIPIPDQVIGAQALTLSFNRTKENVAVEEYGTCSAAFFLDRDEQVFTFGGGDDGGKMPLDKALLPQGERRMILDWAIGSSTCHQAQSYTFEPLCSSGACVDAPSGAGYLCKCYQGYDGNPYDTDGCQDIDECRDQTSNNCKYQNFCNNTPGGYTCSCPENNVGDGFKNGTGCNTNTTLVPPGSPTQQQQGIVCSHPEKNPCKYLNYCTIDMQGIASCACPHGMSGDGQKMGSGCQKHFPLDTALGVCLALMVTMTTAVSCYCWAIKKRELARKRAELFRKNGGLLLQQRFSTITSQGESRLAKIFSAEELNTATDNYSDSRILGRGGHGTVYKGILLDQTVIAIKKSKVFDDSQVEQFVNEITILSQIDHPHVVKLLGCCLETQVPLLVYEFIPNGTLFQHIHNKNAPRSLMWEDCLRIASEIAEALAHLHSTSSIPIIHRDIKSSNILLDENFVAKIADFGASRSVPFDQTHITTLIQGTIGYLDPEYFQSGQLTEKSDVYSFGVVLAELLTRQKPISTARPEESCNLAMHLVVLFNEGRLLQEIEPYILAEAGEEQFYAVAELSVRCLNVKGEERPSMKEVASVLDGLRRSLTMEQTFRRKDESVQKNSEQEVHLPRKTRPISSLQPSEVHSAAWMLKCYLLLICQDNVAVAVDTRCTVDYYGLSYVKLLKEISI